MLDIDRIIKTHNWDIFENYEEIGLALHLLELRYKPGANYNPIRRVAAFYLEKTD